MSLKKIDTRIASIAKNAAALNEQIHGTAMMIVEHAKAHGDCTRALALVRAMPASMRRTMLVLWFTTFTPIRVVEKNDKCGMLKKGQKGYVEWDVEAARATPFYELAKENKEPDLLDFAALCKLVTRLGDSIEKKIADGKVANDDVQGAMEIAARIKGLRFVKPLAADKAQAAQDKAADADLQLRVVNG